MKFPGDFAKITAFSSKKSLTGNMLLLTSFVGSNSMYFVAHKTPLYPASKSTSWSSKFAIKQQNLRIFNSFSTFATFWRSKHVKSSKIENLVTFKPKIQDYRQELGGG